eukprot:5702160-Amphidinium_carterae.1
MPCTADIEPGAGAKSEKTKMEVPDGYRRGDKVQAEFEGYFYDAVCLMDEDPAWNKIKVQFDIDSSKVDVPLKGIRRMSASAASNAGVRGRGASQYKTGSNSASQFEFSRGDEVEAKFDGYWYPAKIIEDAQKGQVKVHFSIDDSKVLVSVNDVRALPKKGTKRGAADDWSNSRGGRDSTWSSKAAAPKPQYYKGELVEALFQGYWYKAKVEADESYGKVKVHFDIDNSHVQVQVSDVRHPTEEAAPEPQWKRGQRVEAFYDNYWYVATCLSDERGGKVRVHFDIDDSKLDVPSDKVREPEGKTKSFAAGSGGRSSSAAPPPGKRIASHREKSSISWWVATPGSGRPAAHVPKRSA